MRRRLVGAAALWLVAGATGLSAPAAAREIASPVAQVHAESEAVSRDLRAASRRQGRWPDERQMFEAAARAAWAYVDGRFAPGTGLIAPVRFYSIATVWDLGSMLAAVYAAHGLGLMDRPAYEGRMGTMLGTLQRLPLYDGRVFSRAYDTRTGRMIPYRGMQTAGWSATDLGRLLVWLRIVGTDPRFAAEAEAVARRIDFASVVKHGYLWGADIDDTFRNHFTYQEGRIGYEQYAAEGFALWGHRAERALDLTHNALPMTAMGQTLPADRRRSDRLTTEPFVLLGLELGWDRTMMRVARRLVAAQEARYHRTGSITVVSEDAIDQPPHYFYYYCVFTNGKLFGIDVQDRERVVDRPRWISAKAALALHVLMPSAYTSAAVRAVGRAQRSGGWESGVYEETGESTGTANINTAAVILEAALVHRSGAPLLASARRTARQAGSEQP